MRKKYLIPIFIFITLIIASIFIFDVKNIDKKNIQLSSGNRIISKTEMIEQNASEIVLTQRVEKNKIISTKEREKIFLHETTIDEIKEQESSEEYLETDEEFQMKEEGIAELENRILEATKKETKRQKREKDIQETLSMDDIDAHMEELKTDRQRLLENENIPDWLRNGIGGLNYLKERYNLDIGMAYRGVAQYEGVTGSFGGGGNIDIFGRYKPTKNSSFGFNLRARHNYGSYSSNEFANRIGSLYAVSPSYENLSPYLTEFWYQYLLSDLTVRLGFINRNSFIDNSFYRNQNRYFLSSTFSLSPYNALPENGLGLVLKYKKPKYYTIAYVADSDAKKGESLGNALDRDTKFYSALELGLTPEDGKYYVTLWNKDSSDLNKDKNKGAIFSANKIFENNYKFFTKYAISSKSTEKEHLEFGVGRKDIYREHDLISMAFSISNPSEDLKTQTTTEIFYRYNIYYGVQLTTSMQIVNNPSKSDENWAILPGVRVRMVF